MLDAATFPLPAASFATAPAIEITTSPSAVGVTVSV